MKNILPYENIVYETHLSENYIQNRINDIIRIQNTYKGYSTNNAFEIKRNINYQNSFSPKIKGEFQNEWGKTIIRVKMKLPGYVIIFLGFWFSFIILIGILFPFLIKENEFGIFSLIPYVMLIMGCALTIGAFKFESIRSKKDLQQIFEATIIK